MKGKAELYVTLDIEPTEDELLDAEQAWSEYMKHDSNPLDHDAWVLYEIAMRRFTSLRGFVETSQEPRITVAHEHHYVFNRYCGAYVCDVDDYSHHRGLARCYCGWAEDGGNGRRQLEEMGEVIDPEPYYGMEKDGF